jgi:enoyl-CoA hydratase
MEKRRTAILAQFIDREHIKCRTKDRFATVSVNFPPANAMPLNVREELIEVLDELLTLEEVRVIIITGAGDKFFMSGANIPELLPLTPEAAGERIKVGRQFHAYVENYPRPVICALNGLTLGGGLEFSLCCDFRLAADHIKLGLPEVNLGIMPGGGGTQRLPRLIGMSKTKELIYTGRLIPANEALSLGIVDKVVPFDQLMEEAQKMAERIARKAPLAVRAAKQAVNASQALSLQDGMNLENKLWADLFATEDKNEGVKAFLEKRSPSFKGK